MRTQKPPRWMKDLAREIVNRMYRITDDIWNGSKVSLGSMRCVAGKDTIRAINCKMPNLIVSHGRVGVDELADMFGFESTHDLIDVFLNYVPKSETYEKLLAQIEREYGEEGGPAPAAPELQPASTAVDDVPF